MENKKNLGVVFGVASSLQDIVDKLEEYSAKVDEVSCEEDEREEKTPLLTVKEAAYLYTTIRPFRRYVNGIEKKRITQYEGDSLIAPYEALYIYYRTMEDEFGEDVYGTFVLPYFPKDRYYKGLEAYTCYSLEELGLLD